MVFARGLLLVMLLGAGLLSVAPGFSKENGVSPDAGASKVKALIVGKWKHEKDKTIITLVFAADRVKFKSNKEGARGSGEGTYRVLDDKTLQMPKVGAAFDEKVTIDRISADTLVLSGGGTWQFRKTKLRREK